MKTFYAFLIVFACNVLPAGAQDGPYIIGSGGNLYKGIEPEIYLQNSGIDSSPYEWCFWPLGCIGSIGDGITPLPPGAGFDPSSFGRAVSGQIDSQAGTATVPTLDTIFLDQPIIR